MYDQKTSLSLSKFQKGNIRQGLFQYLVLKPNHLLFLIFYIWWNDDKT